MRSAILPFVGAAILAGAGCGGTQAEKPAEPETMPAEDYRVRRADFVQRFLLTGELKSVRSDNILVPPNPSWNIQIR